MVLDLQVSNEERNWRWAVVIKIMIIFDSVVCFIGDSVALSVER